VLNRAPLNYNAWAIFRRKTVALNVGPDFKQRWLNVPEAVRQVFIDDLSRVCDVLLPETKIEQWQQYDQQAQQQSFARIEDAFAVRKAELIEAARIRRQRALEKALAEKRAEEQAHIAALKADEERQFLEQTQLLNEISQNLKTDMHQSLARYHKNPPIGANIASSDDLVNELENVRIRLEIEAEMAIEEAVIAFRKKLKYAAHEEIEYLLAQCKSAQQIEETA
jgi:hypothetical protein